MCSSVNVVKDSCRSIPNMPMTNAIINTAAIVKLGSIILVRPQFSKYAPIGKSAPTPPTLHQCRGRWTVERVHNSRTQIRVPTTQKTVSTKWWKWGKRKIITKKKGIENKNKSNLCQNLSLGVLSFLTLNRFFVIATAPQWRGDYVCLVVGRKS